MVLYMGVVALFGVQMVERFFLMFMAPGQHPDVPYLKNVRQNCDSINLPLKCLRHAKCIRQKTVFCIGSKAV